MVVGAYLVEISESLRGIQAAYSGTFNGPSGENISRIMSDSPTSSRAAAKRSGLSVNARRIRIPPALPAEAASLAGLGYPFCSRYSAHAMKSFHVFGFFSCIPAWCHSSPLSFAKTPTETKNGTSLGRERLNTILASKQHEDFGGQEPACARSAHIY